MRKSVQKNHNKANFQEKPFTPPYQQKKHRFHPINQDKIGTIIFQFHFTDPFGPSSDPSDLSDLSDTKSISEI